MIRSEVIRVIQMLMEKNTIDMEIAKKLTSHFFVNYRAEEVSTILRHRQRLFT